MDPGATNETVANRAEASSPARYALPIANSFRLAGARHSHDRRLHWLDAIDEIVRNA
jgi:hypothetical protein